MSNAAKRGRASKRDAIVMNDEKSTSEEKGEKPEKEEISKGERRAIRLKLKDEIRALEATVKAMRVNARSSAKKGTDEGGASSGSALDFAENASSSSAVPMKEEDILRRLVDELSSEVEQADPDIELITGKMERLNKLWSDMVIDEMRGLLKDANGNTVETLELVELNEKVLVDAMNGEDLKHFSIAEYKKKPEQPKGCSRGVWMEHLKMSKKFADCFALMSCAHRSGNVESIDWTTTKTALALVEDWLQKWHSNESMMKEIQKIVPYEIIRRVQEYEYFNCLFCNTVDFSVTQFISHFSSGTHMMKTTDMAEMEGPLELFYIANYCISNLTTLSSESHAFFSAQFTTPLVKSGAKAPQASPDSLPSLDFLDKMERKYGKKINGDFDSARLNDSAYVASLLSAIVKNHKSGLGKKMFKELHEYLGTAKTLYCRRCHWKVTSRDSFYRHIRNPFHLSMCYMDDGRLFNLLTVSINVHMRDDN